MTMLMAKNTLPTQLPQPQVAEVEHCNAVLDTLLPKLPMSFAQYMQHVLYAPQLGYYQVGTQKFGESGDFVTAPEISPLFAMCIARQIEPILQAIPAPTILEIGAGSGSLAVELLLQLEEQNALPDTYYILEPSPDLKHRQMTTIREGAGHLLAKVEWLTHLPQQAITGVILANEVMDAMPVHIFKWRKHHFQEFYVDWQDEQLIWDLQPIEDARLQAECENVQRSLETPLSDGYQSEINLNIAPWIASLSDSLAQGLILLIDYGFPRDAFYHPQREQGTLMCHYKHFAHPDPLILPGIQDITAHVDFTSVANAAAANGLHVAGYCTQTAFLLANGITEIAGQADTLKQQIELSQQIKKLTLSTEMGELFKVMGLTRELDMPLMGFTLQDHRSRL